jgi:predicted DsbA family dithiol-disulfide isomerase
VSANAPLELEVWADIACPWCWIGHERLARALAEEPEGSVVVRPRAFELRPETPVEGVDAHELYVQKFGSPERVAQLHARVAGEGAKEGLELRYDRMTKLANTRIGHRLVALADRQGRGVEALRALFEANFRDGEDVGDPARAATRVAAATGLDTAELEAALERGEGLEEVVGAEARAHELGIGGVPCFVVSAANVGISGAQEPALLRRLIAAGREHAAAA